jgi:5-methylcytosine-specific restriction endonuclease McrA
VEKFNKANFKDKLYPHHRTFWEKAYRKLSAKMSTLKSSLKRRSEEYDVAFEIDSQDIRKMFYDIYGENCKYCEKKLTFRTIACDHIIPLSKGGPTNPENLQLICKACNTRKGPLDEEDFNILIQLVQELPAEISMYVMKKLAKGGRY